MNTPPSITVVIPTYNRKERLHNCINSVMFAANEYKKINGYVQVVLVDDNSTDDTWISIFEGFPTEPRLRCIWDKERRKAAYCRNIGALRWGKDDDGKYIDWYFFLDSDNQVNEDIFVKFYKYIKDKTEKLGFVVALSYKYPDRKFEMLGGKINWWTGRYKDDHEELLYAARKFEDIDNLNLPDSFKTTANMPNAVFVRKAAFDIVGGYNVAYEFGLEDLDFSTRLIRNGFDGVVCTTTRTRHFHTIPEDKDMTLRNLGIHKAEYAYTITRNKSWMMKYFAPWYVKPIYFLTFAWIPGLYFAYKAIKYKRFDCAKAAIKGMLTGIFTSAPDYEKNNCRHFLFSPVYM